MYDVPAKAIVEWTWVPVPSGFTKDTWVTSVEVKVDEGAWQPAAMDARTKDKYGWKLFTYNWTGVTPGAHTLVSRVTDVNGKVQPTAQELETKKSFLEENSQAPRKVMVS